MFDAEDDYFFRTNNDYFCNDVCARGQLGNQSSHNIPWPKSVST
jgi:hypothetical protein